MYRWLWMGSLAALLIGSTGCLHHNVRGGCGSCNVSSSSDCGCQYGACGGSCGNDDCCGSCASNSCGGDACGGPVGLLTRLKHRDTQGGSCASCGSGVLGRLGGLVGMDCCGCCGCGYEGCRGGCVAGPIGWQQGGLDYSSHLQPCAQAGRPCGHGPGSALRPGFVGSHQGGLGYGSPMLGANRVANDYNQHMRPGLLGHNAPAALNSRPFTAGPPTGQVAYPYYSIRSPRDFLMDSPPTIGY